MLSPTSSEREIEYHFIDAGQADSTLIRTENTTLLIDAGHWQRNDVVKYLEKLEIKEIDLLVGTHPHPDHIGQMPEIIEKFEVEEVWMSGETHASEAFERTMDAIEESDIDYYEPRNDEVFRIGLIRIEVLHPTSLTGDPHEGCLALRTMFGDSDAFFTGDIGGETENRWRVVSGRNVKIRGDIYQVGRHGSRESSSRFLLYYVRPKVAVYSAGENNGYGYPHEEFLQRLKKMSKMIKERFSSKRGITLYGTDVHGTVKVVADMTGDYRVETETGEEPIIG